MALELIYTSAPQGLKKGTFGFCTVARSRALTDQTAATLEALSGYRRIRSDSASAPELTPVVCARFDLNDGGASKRVLCRIADAGLDYSNRTNKIAQYFILDSSDMGEAGPVPLFTTPGVFIDHWTKAPQWFDAPTKLPHPRDWRGTPREWTRLTYEPGWAGVLASTVLTDRPVALIVDPRANVLELYCEALELLPPELRWKATFTTFYTKTPPGVKCQWKAVYTGSSESFAVKAIPNILVIDLTIPSNLPRPESIATSAEAKRLVAMARGEYSESKIDVPPMVPSAKPIPTTIPPQVAPQPSATGSNELYNVEIGSAPVPVNVPKNKRKILNYGRDKVLPTDVPSKRHIQRKTNFLLWTTCSLGLACVIMIAIVIFTLTPSGKRFIQNFTNHINEIKKESNPDSGTPSVKQETPASKEPEQPKQEPQQSEPSDVPEQQETAQSPVVPESQETANGESEENAANSEPQNAEQSTVAQEDNQPTEPSVESNEVAEKSEETPSAAPESSTNTETPTAESNQASDQGSEKQEDASANSEQASATAPSETDAENVSAEPSDANGEQVLEATEGGESAESDSSGEEKPNEDTSSKEEDNTVVEEGTESPKEDKKAEEESSPNFMTVGENEKLQYFVKGVNEYGLTIPLPINPKLFEPGYDIGKIKGNFSDLYELLKKYKGVLTVSCSIENDVRKLRSFKDDIDANTRTTEKKFDLSISDQEPSIRFDFQKGEDSGWLSITIAPDGTLKFNTSDLNITSYVFWAVKIQWKATFHDSNEEAPQEDVVIETDFIQLLKPLARDERTYKYDLPEYRKFFDKGEIKNPLFLGTETNSSSSDLTLLITCENKSINNAIRNEVSKRKDSKLFFPFLFANTDVKAFDIQFTVEKDSIKYTVNVDYDKIINELEKEYRDSKSKTDIELKLKNAISTLSQYLDKSLYEIEIYLAPTLENKKPADKTNRTLIGKWTINSKNPKETGTNPYREYGPYSNDSTESKDDDAQQDDF